VRKGSYLTISMLLVCWMIVSASSDAMAQCVKDGESPELTSQVRFDNVRYWTGDLSKGVIYDNGMIYQGLGSSQDDYCLNFDPIIADDFMLDGNMQIITVNWIGGYWNGPPDDGDFDWQVVFYTDFGDGSKPGAALGTYFFANADVNETFIDTNIFGSNIFSYSATLPAPLSLAADTKYWLSIQGMNDYPPQSGWAYHISPILSHQAVFKSVYFGYPDWTDISTLLTCPGDMCFQLTGEDASWSAHKMHFPQLPDPDGWDVVGSYPQAALADDWMCSESGYITNIHFWGSWCGDILGEINEFWVAIYSNIPSPPFSKPGDMLWSAIVSDFEVVGPDSGDQGYYVPNPGWWEESNHTEYFRYDITDISDPFYQDSGTVYWLAIQTFVDGPGYPTLPFWGWKSSSSHWEDAATWTISSPPVVWTPLYDPISAEPIDLAFVIAGETPMVCGDANNDGVVNLTDAIYLLNYLFKEGSSPTPYLCVGDVNNDDAVNLTDAIYILNYLFKGSAAPDPDCCNPTWGK
jgi:hypothetical protein